MRELISPKPANQPTVALYLRIPPDLKNALEERAHAEGQPQSYIVEQALRRYLGKGKGVK
jgi:predicted transcriptional regulator